MFFKFASSFNRQFSHFSVRIFGKKLINSQPGTFINGFSIPSSPTKRKRGMFEGCRSITMHSQLRDKITLFQLPIMSEASAQVAQKSNMNEIICEEPLINGEKESFVRSIDVMFPLLTGEELRAFDSSVYE